MSILDRQFWSTWTRFEDVSQFRTFLAWALNGSYIEQRMVFFTDVPTSWEVLKPYA